MFFEMRDESNIIEDIKIINNICQEYQNYKKMVFACIKKFNIKEIQVCKHDITKEQWIDIIKCPKCKGTEYNIILNEESENN